MAVQEYNQTENDDTSQLKILGYNIELDTLIETTGTARTALIISEGLRYSRRAGYPADKLFTSNCNNKPDKKKTRKLM